MGVLMKSIRSFLLLLSLLSIPTLANSQTVLYCSAELATGILKKDGKWKTGAFQLGRWTAKFNSEWTGLTLKGKSSYNFACRERWPRMSDLNYSIICENTDYIFHYDKKNMTFLYSSTSPFTYSKDYSDTSTLSAGKCEKF